MQTKHLNTAFELKREPDADGSFEGYASVFDVIDEGMDVVDRGAFANTIGKRNVRMLWQHDMKQPIGVWEEIKVDDHGLFVKGRILKEIGKGAEAMALLKAGAIDSMSIGYSTKAATEEGNGSVRRLMDVDLYEISLVTFPMLPDAQVTAVKSIKTIREFENALRDAGFSQREAKAISANGFTGLAAHRDDVVDLVDTEGMKALKSQLTQLQESFNGT